MKAWSSIRREMCDTMSYLWCSFSKICRWYSQTILEDLWKRLKQRFNKQLPSFINKYKKIAQSYQNTYLCGARKCDLCLIEKLIIFKWDLTSRLMAPWCFGFHYCKNPFMKVWTQVLGRFRSCRSVAEVYHDENLWLWFRLEIRLDTFCRSTIPQKKLIISIRHPKWIYLQMQIFE